MKFLILAILLCGCEKQKSCNELYQSDTAVVESFHKAQNLYEMFKVGDYVRVDSGVKKGVEGRIMSKRSPYVNCDSNSGLPTLGASSVFVVWSEVEVFSTQLKRSYYEVDLREVSKIY